MDTMKSFEDFITGALILSIGSLFAKDYILYSEILEDLLTGKANVAKADLEKKPPNKECIIEDLIDPGLNLIFGSGLVSIDRFIERGRNVINSIDNPELAKQFMEKIEKMFEYVE